VWIKNTPRNNIRQNNNFGQFYLNERDANFGEQLEMSYRSLGKAYDWDTEKYRKADKGADKGNRRRFFRNFARFVKNPPG